MLKFLSVAKILKNIQIILTPPRLFHWVSFMLVSFMLGIITIINIIFKPEDSLNKLLFNGSLICLMIAITWRTNQPPFTWRKFSLSPLLAAIFTSIILYLNLPKNSQSLSIIFIPVLYLFLTLLYKIFKNKSKTTNSDIIKPKYFIYLLFSFLLSTWLAMHFLINSWLQEYPSFRQQNMDNSDFVIKLNYPWYKFGNQTLASRNRKISPNTQEFNRQLSTDQNNNQSGNKLADRRTNSINDPSKDYNDINQYFGTTILDEAEKVLTKELEKQEYLTASLAQLKSRVMSNFDTAKNNLSGIKESKFWKFEPPSVIVSESGYIVDFKLLWQGPRLEKNNFYLIKRCVIEKSYKSLSFEGLNYNLVSKSPVNSSPSNNINDHLYYNSDSYNNFNNNQLTSNKLYKFTPISRISKSPVLGPGCPDPHLISTDYNKKPLPRNPSNLSLDNCKKPLKSTHQLFINQPKPATTPPLCKKNFNMIPSKNINNQLINNQSNCSPRPSINPHVDKLTNQNHQPVDDFIAYCYNPNISDLSKKLRQCPQFSTADNRENKADKLQKIYGGENNLDLPATDSNNTDFNNTNSNSNSNNSGNSPNINQKNRENSNNLNNLDDEVNNQNNQVYSEPLSFSFPKLPKWITNIPNLLEKFLPTDRSNTSLNNNNSNKLNNKDSSTNNDSNNFGNNITLPINTNMIKCEPIKKQIIPDSYTGR